MIQNLSEREKKTLSTLWSFCCRGVFYRFLWKGQPDGWKLNQNNGGGEWIASVQLSHRHTGFLYVWELIFLVYKDSKYINGLQLLDRYCPQ